MLGSNFEVLLADNPLAQSMHYRLRYQVYCLETGFENANRFPDGEEKDEFDEDSTHFLVKAKHTDEWIAAIRLVYPRHGLLPMESFCHIDTRVKQSVAGQRIMEVSRLSIVEGYRRRRQDKPFLYGNRSNEFLEELYLGSKERRKQPEILMSMLCAISTYGREHDVQQLFFLITPALARLLTCFNIQPKLAGPACKHRGLRYPYSMEVEKASLGLAEYSSAAREVMCPNSAAYRAFSEACTTYEDFDYPDLPRRIAV
jgi:N-acyl amino acid synthase of PEP-CTERM/exosortase system